MTIFIGGAWPYANGSLHIGHIAALLPGDILARYFRMKGEGVLYVSGSDCHGTPISIRGKKENMAPTDIANKYHSEFKECFQNLGFSYDLYTRTDNLFHKKVVQEIFKKLLNNGYLYKKVIQQNFCENCDQFLPDRYITGSCPNCGNEARGDQCDHCCSILNPSDLQSKKCMLCGNTPTEKETEHFYLALSKLQNELQEYVKSSKGWRENSIHLTNRYLEEGLLDRAATRDLDLGIDVPIPGFEEKKIYVWIEAVCGYLSASKQWAQKNNREWEIFWRKDTISYYVHGKDNIPFHTLILPGILLGVGDLNLPDKIISSEYLTLEGKKISTSKNWAIWVPYLLKKYNPDSIRYFLTINGPEKRDGDFSWREFINSHNGELLGAFGNFVNRTLVFVNKSFNGKMPRGEMNQNIKKSIQNLYDNVGKNIEDGKFKDAMENIFELIRSSNKYFDEEKPWIQVKEDIAGCNNTLYTCVQLIYNFSKLLFPFLPFTCHKIQGFLNISENIWNYMELTDLVIEKNIEILFKKIDKECIDEEIRFLEKNIH